VKDGLNGYDPLRPFLFMKKHTKTFVRLNYDILAIKELTNTDKIALAYNWGDWGKGGYFATNRYAAGVLGMNIKTFEKSALKLKKLGLWKVRGKFVEPSTSPTPVGDPPTPVGPMPTPVGIESAILPLKTEVLLDSLLDNKLEKDKKELLDNAAVAANSNSSSLSLNNSEDLKINQVQTNLVSDTFYNGDASDSLNKVEGNETGCIEPNLGAGMKARPPTKEEMIDANFDALMRDEPPPFSDEQVRAGAPKSLSDEFEELFGRPETPGRAV
jgi:hypothetical protein